MECKKLFIFICILICLFSVAGVCAGDAGETVAADDGTNQTASVDVLSLSSEDMESDDVETFDENVLGLNDDEKLGDNENATSIVASDMTTSYQKEDYLMVTLKDNKNNSIAGANLTVSLKGVKDYATNSNGQIRVPTKDLDAGTYDVGISFAGNGHYGSSSKTVKITVNRVDSILSINENYALNYGGSLDIAAGIVGASGISAYIGNNPVSVNGSKIRLSKLNAGTYTLAVTTIPDANHNAVSKNASVTVNKVSSQINISDIALDYGGDVSINVMMDGVAGVVAKIDGQPVDFTNNRLKIDGLNAGSYTLTVTSIPDENHYSVSKNVTVTINKVDSSVSLKDVNLAYGSSLDMTVDSRGATKLIAKIDGMDVNVNGNIISIPKLDVGNYTLTVTTVPDSNHKSVTRTANVHVDRVGSKVIVSDLNATAGQHVNFNVIVASFEIINDGTVSLFDGKTEIGHANVKNGISTFSYAPSKAGNYTLLAVYSGTSIYKPSNSTFMINVRDASGVSNSTVINGSRIIVVPSYDRTTGVLCVEIIMSSDATGNVTLTVNNRDYVLKLLNGTAKVNLADLDDGDYPYTVTYSGNSKYISFTDNGTFKVNKTDVAPVENTTQSRTYINMQFPSLYGVSSGASFELRFPADVTGNVTLTVNGKNHVFEISNGAAKITVPELGDGSCPYVIAYSGDAKYLPFNSSGYFKDNKTNENPAGNSSQSNPEGNSSHSSPVIVVPSLDGVSGGDSVVIDFPADAKGTVTLTVNNNAYVFNVANGVCIVELPDLDNGIYPYTIAYSGDSRYSSCSGSGSLKVNRTDLNPVDDVAGNNSSEFNNDAAVVVPSLEGLSGGDSAEIKLPEDATGTVTLTVDNKNYVFYVVDGVCDVEMPDLDNGVYPYSIAYSGDARYSSFVSNGSFKVNKTDLNPIDNATGNKTNSSEQGPEIVVPSFDGLAGGDSAEIRLPSDATGTVLLTIGNTGYVFNVVDGVCNVRLPDLDAGEYKYTIKYSGDAKYPSFTSKGSFKVNKTNAAPVENATGNANSSSGQNVQVAVPALDSLSGDSFVIELPSDAEGNITLSVNNKDYVFKVVNGVCDVKLPDTLANGNYQYTLTYSGDAKYSSFSDKGSLKVNHAANSAANSKVTVSDTKVTYGTDAYYMMTIYGTDGKVAKGVDVEVKINGKKFKTLKTDSNGMIKFKVTQNPGTYNLQAKAPGITITGKLIVKHLVSLKKVAVKKSAKKLVLTATLSKVNKKYLKNKKITFKFNGKTYKAKSNSKGVAKVTVKSSVLKKLKVGKKVTYQATYLKDTVKYTVKVKK